MKLKKGDKVIVISGKDKGKIGQIEEVYRNENKVLVAGVNIKKKHRKTKEGEEGQIISIPNPVDASNVMLIDPKEKKPTKLGKKLVGKKYVRISKITGNEV